MCLSTRSFQPHLKLFKAKPAGIISLPLILAITCALQILAITVLTFLCLFHLPIGTGITPYFEQIQLTESVNVHTATSWITTAPIGQGPDQATSQGVSTFLTGITNQLLPNALYSQIAEKFLLQPHASSQPVNVTIPVSVLFNQLVQRNHIIASFWSFWIVLTIGNTIYLNHKLVQPILQLSTVSQQIAQGKFVPPIYAGRIKELATLANSFHSMGIELQRARQSLALHSQILEQRVFERTQALEQEVRKRSAIETVLHEANQELEQLAFVDGLTQLLNRRHFDDRLNQEWGQLRRTEQPLSIILCDIDYFKQYNDTYGHLAGDDCLRKVSQALQQIGKRPADVVARYGGEEFALMLPETTLAGAIQMAQEVQNAIRSLKIPHRGSPRQPYVTASVGVASLIPSANFSPQQLIANADQALYQAKSKGRDCMVFNSLKEVCDQQLSLNPEPIAGFHSPKEGCFQRKPSWQTGIADEAVKL